MSPRSRRRGGNQRKGGGRPNQQNQRNQRQAGAAFWGDPAQLPQPRQDVRITEDPSAVARSLGPPPLPGQEIIAEHYFSAVYDRAVGLAGAVATAGGLITPEAVLDEDRPDDGGQS